LNNKKLLFLKNKILKTFNLFKNNVLKYNNTDFDITTSWVALSKQNEFTEDYHKHSNCFYSGVLYLKAEENCGNIEFGNFNNNSFLIIPTEYNIYNTEKFNITPKENLIIFFPSETYHTIKKNNSNEERISISFNFIPINNFGNGDSTLNISLN